MTDEYMTASEVEKRCEEHKALMQKALDPIMKERALLLRQGAYRAMRRILIGFEPPND